MTAYIGQYEAEDHLYKISEHTDSAIIQQIRNIEKEKKDTKERLILMKAEFKKLEDKLNLSKDVVAMDKTTFLQWQEYLNNDEEDQQLIQKYIKSDRKKLKVIGNLKKKSSVC